jgi:hypothetical protein
MTAWTIASTTIARWMMPDDEPGAAVLATQAGNYSRDRRCFTGCVRKGAAGVAAMRKPDVNIVLFVAGILMASNGLIALVIGRVLGSDMVSALIWGAVALLGLVLTSMTWRQVLRLLMQPRERASNDR